MANPDAPKTPETLNDADLDDATGGFEAWPAKWNAPVTKTGAHAVATDSLGTENALAGPLIQKSLCNNEVVE